MHAEAWRFIEGCVPDVKGHYILDLGSCDVNGSPRALFPGAASYLGIDVRDGRGVDVVADARDWMSGERFDTVICTETLEHVDRWWWVIDTAARHAEYGGYVIVTAAAPGREPHSAVTGEAGIVVAPDGGEHYENIDPPALWEALTTAGLEVIRFEYDRYPGDVRALARKP